MSWLLRLPLFVLLIGLAAAAMLVPAMHAYVVRDLEVARAFFYSAVVGFALFGLLGITTASFNVRRQARSHLISMMACFSVLPLYLALPFAEVVRDTHFLNAYVEMVSCITTTGLTLFEAERLPDSLHLWRALVGWLGGFFIWVAAIAVLAPLSLGGFEVDSSSSAGQGSAAATATDGSQVDASARILRYATRFAPVYALITGALWVALLIAGETSLVAVSHAMSTIATSGISPLDGGTTEAVSGYRGEAIVWLFFIFALSRVTFSVTERRDGWHSIVQDPEVRVGVVLIAVLPVLLYVRHGLVTFEDGAIFTLSEGIASLWGGFFTVASFLTTTGFVSSAWTATQTWSGLDNPGILLMGLAIFGGGVATTAGGVKLLRVYALYKHGLREMERVVQASA
ncbi:MAG: TrkH family potassium uptake protein, partial [Boseongicola sp.]|nr:TrkH family potassium uptake protein [Boseongicola sp.]